MRVSTKICIALFAFAGIFDLVAVTSRTFSDWFIDHIFPVFPGVYGRLTSLVPFSVGEWMVVLAIALLALFLVLILLLVFLHRRQGYRHFVLRYVRFLVWASCLVFLEMSMTCVVLYHATPLEEDLSGYGKTYDLEDLTNLRDALVKKCNTMAAQMPRDADGTIITGSGKEMQEEARAAVQNLSTEFPRLSGFQVRPKPMYFSWLMCQGYMQGYYFPFSMEANYNDLMEVMNKPFTMCHEISHTHGYLFEDEANLLGYLACVESDDPVFRYSGYLGILNYVNNDFYAAVSRDEYESHVAVSDLVWTDAEFVSSDTWDQVEEASPLETETVHEAADTSLDVTLKANGVYSGKLSYTHVVGLLLMYYDGDLSAFE